MKFFRNIKFRLTSWYLIMVALLIALFGAVGYFVLVEGLGRSVVTPWDMRMASVVTLPDGTQTVTGFTSVTGQIGADTGYNMVQVPVSRLLDNVADNRTVEIQTGGGKPIVIDRGLLADSSDASAKHMWVYLFLSKTDPSDNKLVVAAQSQVGLASTLRLFRRTMFISAAVTLVVAATLGFFLVWRMLRPIHSITEAARGMGSKDLKGRLEVDRRDELGELASTLNSMFERVETAFAAERQVVSDLSHELRMPLAIAQSEATQALTQQMGDKEHQRALETVSREISHLSSVTNRLLFLARSENGSGVVKDDLDLKDLLEGLTSDAEVLCQNKGLLFAFEVSDEVGQPDGYIISGTPSGSVSFS